MNTQLKSRVFEVLLLTLIVLFACYTNVVNFKEFWEFGGSDISVEHQTALAISRGENPYSKILDNDLLRNKKFATLLPLYYYVLLGVSSFSNFVFEQFIYNFRIILIISEVITGILLYLIFRKNDQKALGFLAFSFFLLNRWNIDNIRDGKQDMLALMCIMLSLLLFKNKSRFSYLFYGISVGIKHIGIFIFPYYLIPLLFKEKSLKDFIIDMLYFFLPIIGPSLPFMFNDFKAFFSSMLFSFTRSPVSTSSIPFGYDKILVKYNPTGLSFLTVPFFMLPRILLVLFTLFNFCLLLLKKIPRYFFLFTSILIFVTFNPVVFDQYNVWLTPFFFLSISGVVNNLVKVKA